MSTPTVHRSARCWVSATDDRTRAGLLTAELQFTAADPYAVGLLLGDAVLWRFARDLLADALAHRARPVGDGDIRLRRECDDLRVELSSPEGHVFVWLRTTAVKRFLQRTYTAVAAGAEVIDFDAEFCWLALTTGGDPR